MYDGSLVQQPLSPEEKQENAWKRIPAMLENLRLAGYTIEGVNVTNQIEGVGLRSKPEIRNLYTGHKTITLHLFNPERAKEERNKIIDEDERAIEKIESSLGMRG